MGEQCRYAHSPEELRPAPQLDKTMMCAAIKAGKICPRGKERRFDHALKPLDGVCYPGLPRKRPSDRQANRGNQRAVAEVLVSPWQFLSLWSYMPVTPCGVPFWGKLRCVITTAAVCDPVDTRAVELLLVCLSVCRKRVSAARPVARNENGGIGGVSVLRMKTRSHPVGTLTLSSLSVVVRGMYSCGSVPQPFRVLVWQVGGGTSSSLYASQKTSFRLCSGASCTFAHSRRELRQTIDHYKTNMCRNWLQGRCSKPNTCNHAHGEQELLFYRRLAATRGCRNFTKEQKHMGQVAGSASLPGGGGGGQSPSATKSSSAQQVSHAGQSLLMQHQHRGGGWGSCAFSGARGTAS